MPYWDWAKKEQSQVFPEQALKSDVPSDTPSSTADGFAGAKHNPLHHYPFEQNKLEQSACQHIADMFYPPPPNTCIDALCQSQAGKGCSGTP